MCSELIKVLNTSKELSFAYILFSSLGLIVSEKSPGILSVVKISCFRVYQRTQLKSGTVKISVFEISDTNIGTACIQDNNGERECKIGK